MTLGDFSGSPGPFWKGSVAEIELGVVFAVENMFIGCGNDEKKVGGSVVAFGYRMLGWQGWGY